MFKAAKWAGVAPWEFLERRPLWLNAALQFMAAESDPQVKAAQRARAELEEKARAIRARGSAAY